MDAKPLNDGREGGLESAKQLKRKSGFCSAFS